MTIINFTPCKSTAYYIYKHIIGWNILKYCYTYDIYFYYLVTQ